MAKAKKAPPATPPARLSVPLSISDEMIVYREVSKWKTHCADLLDALNEIDKLGYAPASQLAHEALNRFVRKK